MRIFSTCLSANCVGTVVSVSSYIEPRISWRIPPGRYKSLLLKGWDLQDHMSSVSGRPDDSATKVRTVTNNYDNLPHQIIIVQFTLTGKRSHVRGVCMSTPSHWF